MGDGIPMREIDEMDMIRYLEIYASEVRFGPSQEPEGGWTKRGYVDDIL